MFVLAKILLPEMPRVLSSLVAPLELLGPLDVDVLEILSVVVVAIASVGAGLGDGKAALRGTSLGEGEGGGRQRRDAQLKGGSGERFVPESAVAVAGF